RSGLLLPNSGPGNHVNRPVSVRMENMPEFRQVCQNTAGKHLAQWQIKGFISMQFPSCNLTHTGPGMAAGMRM
ncbi:MAG: hypothetical protein Q7T80_08465, partial [Methanoregula sp.]|nr:hypothetical protein [Methanoregula sp.]